MFESIKKVLYGESRFKDHYDLKTYVEDHLSHDDDNLPFPTTHLTAMDILDTQEVHAALDEEYVPANNALGIFRRYKIAKTLIETRTNDSLAMDVVEDPDRFGYDRVIVLHAQLHAHGDSGDVYAVTSSFRD